jgi:hypothetical protein
MAFSGRGLIRGINSLDGEHVVVFYYLSASKIWPDKRDRLQWKGLYKRGNTVHPLHNKIAQFHLH